MLVALQQRTESQRGMFTEMRDRGTILDATLAFFARESVVQRFMARRALGVDSPALPCEQDFARALVRRAH